MLLAIEFSPGGESMLSVARYFPLILVSSPPCAVAGAIQAPHVLGQGKGREPRLTVWGEVVVADTSQGTSADHAAGLGWAHEDELIKEGTYA